MLQRAMYILRNSGEKSLKKKRISCNLLETPQETPPRTRARTHKIHSYLCSRVYSGDVSTQDKNVHLGLWAGRPAISPAWTHAPPHLTLTSVRKYVYTPHQRRGVVVVVNEKALV